MKNLILLFFSALAWGCCETPKHEISLRPSEYVTTLVGTQSDYSLSTGNTYPAVALPLSLIHISRSQSLRRGGDLGAGPVCKHGGRP